MSAFTKKHYDRIARTLSFTCEPRAVFRLAVMFREDNPKFRHDTFVRACGYHDEDAAASELVCALQLLFAGKDIYEVLDAVCRAIPGGTDAPG